MEETCRNIGKAQKTCNTGYILIMQKAPDFQSRGFVHHGVHFLTHLQRIGTRHVKTIRTMSAKMHGTELSGVKAAPCDAAVLKQGNRTIGPITGSEIQAECQKLLCSGEGLKHRGQAV